ncbi:hypothetical protein D0466_08585 [Peribacillus glennii]|uniref:Uncharacterized protein n=1 Tax=Peribacillus glennii TaxID=2303991 RepID=A0A372LHX3_9BACI|nr:hypothetical protein D0466_08585 [Peribacillus glennii]
MLVEGKIHISDFFLGYIGQLTWGKAFLLQIYSERATMQFIPSNKKCLLRRRIFRFIELFPSLCIEWKSLKGVKVHV